MQLKKFTIDKNVIFIAYKLAYDLLLLLLVTLAASLVVEGLLPGLLSSKISLSKISLVLILVLLVIGYLAKNMRITYGKPKINRSKVLPMIVLFSFLLIGNSLLKFSFWENIIITLVTLFIFFLFFEIIFNDQAE